ncbi:hypothetical protein [Microbulbifer sp.]|uniref:hypothetical protein n=1 Tax=Microbulbifer sp. TaxID=1908541 RepID=UPI003F2A3F8F
MAAIRLCRPARSIAASGRSYTTNNKLLGETKMKIPLFAITLTTLTFAISAQAHDPSQHKDKAEKPQCAALKDMDMEKMDKQDPVTQALIKKCMKQLHPEEKPETEK